MTLYRGDIEPVTDFDRVVAAEDVTSVFTWTDFGLATQRIAKIDYTSTAVLTGHTATKTFVYTLVNGAYRLDTMVKSYV